ncbi:hypothetical protein JCM10212_006451 [Sporobolomyces blumeae]
MPRPTRQRSSLPGHSRAAQLPPAKTISTPDALDDSYMMDPAEMAPIQAPNLVEVEPATQPQEPIVETRTDQGGSATGPRRTKAEKAQARRQNLLDQINSRSTPYSKSHARRLKRSARPSANLVTSLSDVHDVLPSIEPESAFENDESEVDGEVMGDAGEGHYEEEEKSKDGKGKEKLTAKKRQRVLTSESTRLPAVLSNSHFSASPFATIRQHTLNTISAQKAVAGPSVPGSRKGKKKNK